MNKSKPKKGLKRNTIDKYYTKTSIVDLCINYIKDYICIDKSDLIIEPSAGNGAFISNIKLLSDNYKFYDLKPETGPMNLDNEIITQDYLLFDINSINITDKSVHVIGNPPFGRQSSLAIKFIKKSCEFCDTLSFILPKSFKKDSLKRTFPLNFHLIFEIDLPEKSFLVDSKEHDVPCVFQIWQKKTINRQQTERIEPSNFKFVKKEDEPDISFRRVGVNAGVIDKNIDEKSVQSHYFIKFTNDKPLDDNIKILSDNVSFEFDNTVGPKSISKQELISKFNQLLI
jgi:predicted RNA methylase